ncbi:hypothetical protein BS47DRAFT_1402721 [Hydnum rufescens UP504]|uniref:Uncharacterized protein n=1 Tax=Hydnum rufescens UP504 TaxID=1448309 RepID=A0A9P6ADH0_9AGAM|nr:hypothetical protein BS47DRAFT_1402721 [Hydnum rufescens UP504]
MADKLLKLHIELTFAQLYKLRKLHQGKTLSTPMASEDSLPPTPELRDRLHKAWHDPCLPTKKVARRALTTGWEAIQGDIEGTHPIITATRHPFSGNQASKFAEYDVSSSPAQNSKSQVSALADAPFRSDKAWEFIGAPALLIDLDASPLNWQDIPPLRLYTQRVSHSYAAPPE